MVNIEDHAGNNEVSSNDDVDNSDDDDGNFNWK